MKKQIKIAYFPSNRTKDIVLNKNGRSLDKHCIKCETEEDLSTGNYTLDATFIVENRIETILKEEAILKVLMDYGYEIFRISKVSVGTRYIEVVARQITIADSLTLWLEDVRPTNLNGAAAGSYLIANATGIKEINIISDITTTATAYYQKMNLYTALHDTEQSFQNRWGGEVLRRGYTIYINKTVGINRGFSIRERKNLTGFKVTSNIDELVTRAQGQGFNGITGDYIDSPIIGSYRAVYTGVIKYDDVKVKDENSDEGYNTLAEAKAELNRRINEEFSVNGIDKIKAAYDISFVQLEKTVQYKNYSLVERSYLGDTCKVYISKIGVDINVRALNKRYDVLAQKTKEVKLSNYIIPKAMSIKQIIEKLNSIDSTTTILEQAKINASDLIKAGLKNSYVIVRSNEILIMDTQDINTATKVWRFNVNGLGYSSTGYNGTFGLAMTMDGAIVADFITVGILNANLIKTGVLKSFNNLSWINMDNGTFNFANRLIFDGTTMSLTGDFTTYDADTGNKAIEITKRIQSFKDWDSNNECARIFSGKLIGEETTRGLSIMGRSGKYVSLGYEDGAGLFQHAIFIDTGAYGNPGYVQFNKDARFYQNIQIDGTAHIYGLLTMHDDLHPSLDDVYDVGQWGMCWKGMYSFAFNQASDRSKKYNINELETDYSYDVIKNLKPYLYKYIPPQITEDTTEEEKAKIEELQELSKKEFFAGVMADEVPIEMLNHDNEKSINLYSYTTILMGAMQEMMKKVERLENEVRRLGGDV